MKLYIKYMVSRRCKLMVEAELKNLGLQHAIVELGSVEVHGEMTQPQTELFRKNLLASGLELLDDKKAILIEKISNAVTEMIHHTDELPSTNYSAYISEKTGYDYTYLSNVFSKVKGITLQQYIILNKIERIKELLLYDELNLSEIAWKMHYSSAAHMSGQFKKITGLTPSFYRQIKASRSINLENL